MTEQLNEILRFLAVKERLDLKAVALECVLRLTGSQEGRAAVLSHQEVVKALMELTTDTQPLISRDAHLALLNLSEHEDFVTRVVELQAIAKFLEFIADPACKEADKLCMMLSNLTRHPRGAEAFTKTITTDGCVSLSQLVHIFDRKNYNKEANFDYLAAVFSNITQVKAARRLFLDRSKTLVSRLLPYTRYEGSLVRRGGIVGLLKNMTFEVDAHQWLLSEDVDLLPALLLPLAGPEQFDEEDVQKLPEDLQYLPDDKKREEDPDIRKILLEALMKLCCTKGGRSYLKEKQVYLIVRELHTQEKDEEVDDTCEKLVHMLISDEPPSEMDNLAEVVIPEDIARKFTMSPACVS
ncbi:hypothetical protein EMCRGX_G024871 [Ephydatia muelleri]